MYLIVILTFLDELAVVLRASLPFIAKCQLVEQPHLATQETFAPVGPGFLPVLPTAMIGVERKVVWVVGNQPRHLASCYLQGCGRGRARRLGERQVATFLDSPGGPVHGSTSLLADAANPGGCLGAGSDDGALVFDVFVDRCTAKLAANA